MSEERKKGSSSKGHHKGGGSGHQHTAQHHQGRSKGSFTSSTALTPGTPFMHDVCVSVSHWVCAKLGQDKWRHVSVMDGVSSGGE